MTSDRHLTLLAQEALQARGFAPGPLDGLWGGKTEAAWRAFRAVHAFPSAAKDGPVLMVGAEPSARPASDPAWLRVARAELGVREIAGAADNPRIVEYHQATTLRASDDETPWCAAFVNWCLAQCGVARTRSAMARSFIDFGQHVHPRLGAIIVLKRGAPPSGHVGFYVGGDDKNLRLLGGNQGNRVSIAEFPWSQMLDSRWPAGVAVS